jgi:hypothetical protein
MSRNSIKAVDLYICAANWNDSLKIAYPDKFKAWAKKRDRVLARFRKVMAKVTKEEFLAGRWGPTPMPKRAEDEMRRYVRESIHDCHRPHLAPTTGSRNNRSSGIAASRAAGDPSRHQMRATPIKRGDGGDRSGRAANTTGGRGCKNASGGVLPNGP